MDYMKFILLLASITLFAGYNDRRICNMKNCPLWRVQVNRMLNVNAFAPGSLATVSICFKETYIIDLCTLLLKITVPFWVLALSINLVLLSDDRYEKGNWYTLILGCSSHYILAVCAAIGGTYLTSVAFPQTFGEQNSDFGIFIMLEIFVFGPALRMIFKIYHTKRPKNVKVSTFLLILFAIIRSALFWFLKITGKVAPSEAFKIMYGFSFTRLAYFFLISHFENWDSPNQFSRADLKTVYKNNEEWKKLKEQASKDGIRSCVEFIEDYDFIKNKGNLPEYPNIPRCLSEADLYGTYIEKNAESRLPLKKEFLDFIENEFKQKTLCLADFDSIHEQCLHILYEKSFPKYWKKLAV